MTEPKPAYNLIMLSGDNSIARGIDGAYYQMLARFSTYWNRIDIITPTHPNAKACVIHENVHVHPAPRHRALQPLFINQKVSELMRERPYHLMTSHDFGFFYNGWGAWWLWRKTGIPYTSEILHVEGYPIATNLREQIWRFVGMRYLPFVAKRASAIRVMNAIEVPDLLRRMGIPDEKILLLRALYIDHTIFHPIPDVEKKYDVVFVGRLAQNKGIFTLLKAIHRSKQNYPNISLAIRGEGDLRAELMAYIEAHDLQNNVYWISRLPDSEALAELYNQSKILACASTVEGGPRVTVEAMACKTAVLSTPVGVMPEVIKQGENGYLFQGEDELSDLLVRILNDETHRQMIAQSGYEIAQQFEAEQTIRAYATGYHNLIERVGNSEGIRL